MKKQVKKLSKKIMVLVLATSIIFTSCFSHKKIEAHAASIVATLSAFTLYEVCLYIGGLAVTALGIGYAYNNRDEIAEFGKSVIDSMGETIPETGWMIGSYSGSESCVYGAEVFEAVQNAAWDYIEAGGLSPSTATDLTGDGYVDISDRDFELTQTKYWTTTAGMDAITGYLESIYDKWVNKEEDDIINSSLGIIEYSDKILEGVTFDYIDDMDAGQRQTFAENILSQSSQVFDGYYLTEDGYYIGCYCEDKISRSDYFYITVSSKPPAMYFYNNISTSKYEYQGTWPNNTEKYTGAFPYSICSYDYWNNNYVSIYSNVPVISSPIEWNTFLETGFIPGVTDAPKYYRVADWIDEAGTWMDTLEDIATVLRPLQDVSDIATQLSSAALELSATADIYRDLALDLADTYVPAIDAVIDPVYWPDTNATPALDATDLPNADVANPDISVPDDPGSDDPDEPEIELDTGGLLSLFNILFYIIMIIIMLIYLFLACLAFIVMIFRIPASSAMLPEDMVLGFEHLKTIMIPGMNISIYGFAMALIYMFIIFAVIKALRLEINDFKIPRSFKK